MLASLMVDLARCDSRHWTVPVPQCIAELASHERSDRLIIEVLNEYEGDTGNTWLLAEKAS